MRPTRVRYVVLAGLCGAAALAYFVRNGVASAESTIRTSLGITKDESGLMMSAFFLPYALCQIPAAMFAQRIGARRALPLYGVLWSLATAGMALGSLGMMIGSRAFMGVAQAGLVPVGVSVMSRWFPRTTQASASGAFSGLMSVGSIAAAPLTAWLAVKCGWQWMFVLYALPGLLWAAWFARWHREAPSEHPSVNSTEAALIEEHAPPAAGSSAAIPWRLLLTSPALAFLCAQQFFRAAGYIFFASWFATYLQEARHVTIIGSGWLTTLPLFADVTGCMAGGVFSDAVLRRTGNAKLARQGLCVIALLLCAVLIFVAWRVADPTLAVLVISAGMFCAAIANPCLGAVAISTGGAHAATVIAAVNMCGNFGAALFPIAVPWLLKITGNWDAVLIGFATLYVGAAAAWWMLKTDRSVIEQSATSR